MQELEQPDWISASQVAEMSGFSRSYVYQNLDKIPHYRPAGKGGPVRFKRSQIVEWVESSKGGPEVAAS